MNKTFFYLKQEIIVPLEALYWKIRLKSGYKPDTSVIPEGVYCYTPDFEKNKNKAEDDPYYYTKVCPYYRTRKGMKSGCMFLGWSGWDMAHWDQCKICGENDYDKYDIENE